jgi:hypothetical protein
MGVKPEKHEVCRRESGSHLLWHAFGLDAGKSLCADPILKWNRPGSQLDLMWRVFKPKEPDELTVSHVSSPCDWH